MFENEIYYTCISHRLFIFAGGRRMERAEFLEKLSDSYSAYYDLHPEAEADGLPLAFRADYFSRSERYWLSKNIPIWGNETNEYAYIFSAPSFDVELAGKCIDFALADGLPRVKPHKEHQYTNVKVILIADSFDEATISFVRKRKFSKSYKFSLHGFTDLKAAAVSLSERKAYPNAAAERELTDYFRKLFTAMDKS